MIETARRPGASKPPRRSGYSMTSSTAAHFRAFCPINTWQPPINLYRLRRRLDVCVDLAGVEPGSISVRVEVGRLTIEGDRRAPEPSTDSSETMSIVAMEIDHGPFCRTISLSKQVDHTGVTIHYVKGLLWVRLPFSKID